MEAVATARRALDFIAKMPSPSTQPPRPPSSGTIAPDAASVTIRRVATMQEYGECVRLERETWGGQFTEAVPTTILRIAQEVGGVTAAAFAPDGTVLGFVFGITGVRDGELSHWSDMLAVRADARDMGIGKRLKAYQRDLLLETGVRTMYWTFDPLVARNAHLNLERIGARAVEYRTNFYGEDTGSVMHAALGTDRFIVRWRLAGDAGDRARPEEWRDAVVIDGTLPDPLPDSARVRIAIPDDIFAVLEADAATAHRWRATTRQLFTTYLSRGYTVAGFLRGTGKAHGTYLLER
jgi:predicted GNAT superfamily acetyltransferase